MEPVILESPHNHETFIRIHGILEEIRWHKYKKQLIKFVITSVSVVLLGVFADVMGSRNNPCIYMGILLSILTAFLFFHMKMSKGYHKNMINTLSKRYNNVKIHCAITFTDEFVKYEDAEKSMVFKWSSFSSYLEYRNLLILNFGGSFISDFCFEKTGVSDDIYEKLHQLFSEKLPLMDEPTK